MNQTGRSSVVRMLMLAILSFAPQSLRSLPAVEGPFLSGLRAGDRFVVGMTIAKQTEVTIEGQESTTSDTRDRFEVEYLVTEALKSGDAVVTARVRRWVREAGKQSADSLNAPPSAASALSSLTLRFQLDPQNGLSVGPGPERNAMLATLSGMDPSSSRLLHETCSEDVIEGWFSRPCWAVPGSGKLNEDAIPERRESIGLGPFGTLQTTLQLTRDSRDARGRLLTISGTGRFVPLVMPENTPASAPFAISDLTAELDEMTGKILLTHSPGEDRTAPAAPDDMESDEPSEISDGLPIHNMDITVRIHGRGTAQSAASKPPLKFTFRQSQMQAWVVTEFSPRLTLPRPNYLPNLLDVPEAK